MSRSAELVRSSEVIRPRAVDHRGALSIRQPSPVTAGLLAGLALLGLWLWASMPTLWPLILDWRRDEDYSVGQLVPFVMLYLLWSDRDRLKKVPLRPCWWGIGLIMFGQAVTGFGLAWMYESIERYGMVLTALGVILLVLGRHFFWTYKWLMLFAFMMVPLPGRVHNMISGPLQSLAASGAVMAVELLGVTVSQEGNVMVLNHRVPVAVAEACSGLRMLTAFVMVGCVIAFVIKRPTWQKTVLVLSTIPVAILCNLVRLAVTALLFLAVTGEWAERFHDIAGWAMMPLAVLILVGELWVLRRMVIENG